MAGKNRYGHPTQEFLTKIGIAEIPSNLNLTYYDGHSDDCAFCIEIVDKKGKTLEATAVNAWQSANRPIPIIYRDLRETLVQQFGALRLN